MNVSPGRRGALLDDLDRRILPPVALHQFE
jgi:hypothetical protein